LSFLIVCECALTVALAGKGGCMVDRETGRRWASVVKMKSSMSKGSWLFSENSRYRYLNISARKNESILRAGG